MLRDGAALALWVGLCLGVGWLGAQVTAPALVDWYPGLHKPRWTPPAAAFPIVWTTLFVLMGIAAWLVWRHISAGAGAPETMGPAARWLPLLLFLVQLALNAAWSILFFGLRSPSAAAVEILLLVAAIVATMLAFWRVSPTAGALLVPYLAWVGYATALNLAVWRMNP